MKKRIVSLVLVMILLFSFNTLGVTAAEVSGQVGDADKNGKINSNDALVVLEISVGKRSQTDTLLSLCDINIDNKITSADALIILQKTVGISIPVSKIIIDKENMTVRVGSKVAVTVLQIAPSFAENQSIKWSSSNSNAATVDKNGNVSAIAAGKATITAASAENTKANDSFVINVAPAVSSVSLEKTSMTVRQGKAFTLKPTVYPSNAYDKSVTWSSSNSNVVAVTSKGVVWPKMIGTATIICKTSDGGKKASCTMNVTAMNIPYVSQLPKYPTGCEAASCCMLLKYYGYSINIDQMSNIIPRKNIYIKNGKRYGPDINEMFVGDPKSYYTSANPGYGVFSPAVTKALQKAIDQRSGKHKAVKMTGCTFDELLEQVSKGHPAVVWATYKMKVPSSVNSWYIESTGKYFEYPRGTHVMILSGFSKDSVVTVDPYDNGVLTFSRSTFENRWNLLGKQAIILDNK